MKAVVQDKERFSQLAPDRLAQMPKGYSAPLDVTPTRVLISRRTDEEQVYLKQVDQNTDNACWVVCAKGDPGAVRFIPG